MKTKTLTGLKVTDEAEGRVTAVFATLNVIDSDGDVTRPGAFEDGADVRISAYNHASWGPGSLPVGKGTIHEKGEEAILDGQFFLGTDAGRETFQVVKEMDDLQEWSYGFDVLERAEGVFPEGDEDGTQVQFLDKLKVHEVSPVILGAGVDTRTLAVKGVDREDLGTVVVALLEYEPEMIAATIASTEIKLTDHLAFATATVGAVVDRVAERAEKGTDLGVDLDALERLQSMFDQLRGHLAEGTSEDLERRRAMVRAARALMTNLPPQD